MKNFSENKLKDSFGRLHDYLRISVTDKCNFNCIYCSPESSLKLRQSEVLSYDELLRLAEIFVRYLGISKIRITGGEPLARKNILYFFEGLGTLQKELNFETAITTNGSLLEKYLPALKEHGVNKINISLDSMNGNTFRTITGKAELPALLKNISLAESAGFEVKLNAVIIRNLNSMEIVDFIHFVKDRDITFRFIEYMPFIKNQWHPDKFVSAGEIRQTISRHFGLKEEQNNSDGVARIYRLEGHRGRIGFIAPISEHFCQSCNRLRIKADGKMKLCLFSSPESEVNLKELLRSHEYTDQMIAGFISEKLLLKSVKRPEIQELAENNKNNMMNIGG